MLIFKKITEGIGQLEKEKQDLLDSGLDVKDKVAELDLRIAGLRDLDDIRKRYEWMKNRSAIKKVDAIITSGYDYKGLAGVFNTTVTSLQTTISLASRKFAKFIGGEQVVDEFIKGSVEKAQLDLSLSSSPEGLMVLIPEEVRTMLPDPVYVPGASILDCIKEIEILNKLTRNYMESMISSGHRKKLAFLRYVLGNENGHYSTDREQLRLYFNGDITLEQLVYSLGGDIGGV